MHEGDHGAGVCEVALNVGGIEGDRGDVVQKHLFVVIATLFEKEMVDQIGEVVPESVQAVVDHSWWTRFERLPFEAFAH